MAALLNRKWKVLSLILAAALAVSLGFNFYEAFYAHRVGQNETMDFTFSWGPDRQKIVNGTFRLEISMKVSGDNVTMVVKANDDEYDDYDYVGLVLDTSGNGYIDAGDEPYGLYANNLTGPTILTDQGFLGWAQVRPIRGPQNVTFDKNSGYTFNVKFPFYYPTNPNKPWYDPAATIKNGSNQMQVCFYDYNASQTRAGMEGVFTRFNFNVGG